MIKKILLFSAVAVLLSGCETAQKRELTVTPYPNEVEIKTGTFDAAGAGFHYSADFDDATKAIINGFAQQLSLVSGSESTTDEQVSEKGFNFVLDPGIAEEAYTLSVSGQAVTVKASSLRGVNYAVQTLKQMLPVEIFGKAKAAGKDWSLMCVEISDAPRFGYRGFMLDVARMFYDMDAVKKYIDIIEVHKLNKFHWHLTDDQGWRIEIKKYPRLTEFGSIRRETLIGHPSTSNEYDGTPYGGYFTQEQIKEIIGYAAAKGIDVIPEIDLPGHMLSALASYPYLGCTGGPYEVRRNWGVERDVLCAGNEKTFAFLEDVLTEVAELFPYEYIHIGGDECPKDRWEKCPKCQAKIKELGLKDDDKFHAEHYLQSYMMERVAKFLESKGKKVIGWDEILEGNIGKSATIMSWRGTAGGEKAVKRGNDAIMSPNSHCYVDRYQDDPKTEPIAMGGFVPVEKSYSFEPYTDDMTDEEKARILGVQANMWTEYIATTEYLEYMLHPRLAAISEVQWCQPENKEWNRFRNDAGRLCDMYDILGHKYATHIFKVEGAVQVNAGKKCAEVVLDAPTNIRYTLDGSEPTMESPIYTKPLEIREDCIVKARSERNGEFTKKLFVKAFKFHKAVSRPVQNLTEPNENDRNNCPVQLTDGVIGDDNFNNDDYVGWRQTSFEAVVEMDGTAYSTVAIGAVVDNKMRVVNPIDLVVYTSNDGQEYAEAARIDIPELSKDDKDGRREYSVSFPETKAKFIKVTARCPNGMPEWHPKKRDICYLFIDEVIVK